MASVELFLPEHEGEEVLIECAPEKHLQIFYDILRWHAGKKTPLLILSSVRPGTTILKKCDELGIDASCFSFIDCISRSQGLQTTDTEKLRYVDMPSSLTDISIIFHSLQKDLKSKYCLLIDSLAAMLIYNSPTILTKFLHMLLPKARMTEDSSIFLSPLGGLPQDMHLEILQLCDASLKLEFP